MLRQEETFSAGVTTFKADVIKALKVFSHSRLLRSPWGGPEWSALQSRLPDLEAGTERSGDGRTDRPQVRGRRAHPLVYVGFIAFSYGPTVGHVGSRLVS